MSRSEPKTVALNLTTPLPLREAGAGQRSLLEDDARELNENLASLQSLLRQLLAQATEKLAAIRGADTERMERCASAETNLLEQVSRVDQQRAAVVARLAQTMPVPDARRVSLSELADHFPEPFTSALRARKTALAQIATELQEKNGLVARVARNLQTHIREIFVELAKVNQESVVYGPKGQHEQRNVRSWLDAVG